MGKQADIKSLRRISAIWLLPILALLVGGWMVVQHVQNEGPEIEITFETAEGIEPHKTKIKTRNVEIGVVDKVSLKKTVDGVIVTATLEKEAESLLREDTSFWVVRPRIGSSGVSGLGTLLSGAYIEMSPGVDPNKRTEFVGLEEVPVTPPGTPGLHISLVSEDRAFLSVGDLVLYRNFQVGQVEAAEFRASERKAYYQLFVRAPYDDLVTDNSRFWNAGGIEFDASADGIHLNTGPLEALISGGVAFDVPSELPTGERATAKTQFRLYPDRASAFDRKYDHSLEFVMLFSDSVRGLRRGAPIEYRGIRVGTVANTTLITADVADNGEADEDRRIPVLVHLEPARVGYEDNEQGGEDFSQDLQIWLSDGLAGRLSTGNLLTGSLLIEMDFYNEPGSFTQDVFVTYSTIPTAEGGLNRIADRIDQVLANLQALPLASTVESATGALKETQSTMKKLGTATDRLEKLLEKDSTQAIPENLNAALQEINHTLSGLSPESSMYRSLSHSLEQLEQVLADVQPLVRDLRNKPNALIFSGSHQPDVEPERK